MSDWFRQCRVDWIIQRVEARGFINPVHVERMFDVSARQAALDIQEAKRARPDLFSGNASALRR